MFFGTYRHQIDAKGRLRLPSQFKNELGNTPVFAKGANGCIYVLSKKEVDENLAPKIANLSMFDEDAQKPLRMLFASAFEAEEDAHGRILLPKELREYAHLTKNIAIIGAFNRVEIWDDDAWNEYSKNEEFGSLCKKLSDKGV